MARPSHNEIGAKCKMRNAFWHLMETNNLGDITIGMIVNEAHCNRGSFYYHYHNLDELIDNAIEVELLGRSSVGQYVFDLVSGTESVRLYQGFPVEAVRRISTMAYHGGLSTFFEKLRKSVMQRWTYALCQNGEPLNPNVLYSLDFACSSMAGVVLSYCRLASAHEGMLPADGQRALNEFVLHQGKHLVDCVCHYQNISEHDLMYKLQDAHKHWESLQID